jgi:hypothetical protein
VDRSELRRGNLRLNSERRLVEAAGVERQISKLLTNNHLRFVAAEIRTPSCTLTRSSMLFRQRPDVDPQEQSRLSRRHVCSRTMSVFGGMLAVVARVDCPILG